MSQPLATDSELSMAQHYHVQPSSRHGTDAHKQRVSIVETMDLRRCRVEYDTADRACKYEVGIVDGKEIDFQKSSHDRHTQSEVVVSILLEVHERDTRFHIRAMRSPKPVEQGSSL